VEELAGQGELAARTRLQVRYLREWLGGMAAAGYLEYDPSTLQYAIPAEHVPVLSFFGAAFFDFSTNFGETYHQLLQAFRDGGGVPQSRTARRSRRRSSGSPRPGSSTCSCSSGCPRCAKLERGTTLCDVGCGQGRAVIKLAQAFPRSTFVGYDVYEPAILAAESNAHAARVADRTLFEVRDAAEGIGEVYDVITTFDIVHDSVDPGALLDPVVQGRRKSACAGAFGARLWLRDRRERAFARPVPGLRGGAPVGDHE
jgi:SAM-dependent methyltransferase